MQSQSLFVGIEILSALRRKGFSKKVVHSALLTACAAVPLALTQIAGAATTYYWDADADASNNSLITGAGLGGNGSWDTSTKNWYLTSDVVWAAGSNAAFWGSPGAVNVGTLSVANLYFKTSGFTLSGGTLTVLGSAGALDLTSGANATINSTLSASVNVGKAGYGVLTLGGSNSLTGAGVCNVNGGLTLDFSTNNNAKLSSAGSLNLSNLGGTIALNGGTGFTQSVTSTTVGSGSSSAGSWTIRRTGGSTNVLQMGTITRGSAPHQTIDFASGVATTSSLNNSAGILGTWLTVEGTDWATNVTSTTNGPVAALASTGYTNNTWASTNNVTVTSNGNVASGGSASSLRFNDSAGGYTITLAGNATLGNASSTTSTSGTGGGILLTPNVGAHDELITGGNLLPVGNGAPLTVHQYNSAGKLTIDSRIGTGSSNIYLTKTGPGELDLTGTANGYIGGTSVLGGLLVLNKTSGYALSGSGLLIQGGSVRIDGRGGQINPAAGSSLYIGGTPNTSTLDMHGFSESIGQIANMYGNASILSTGGSSQLTYTYAATLVSNIGKLTAQGTNNLIGVDLDIATQNNAGYGHRVILTTNEVDGLEISGVLSDTRSGGGFGNDPYSFDKQGNGVLTLSNTSNTYAGATLLTAGTLAAASSGSLGDGSSTNTLAFNGGTLKAIGTISSPSSRGVTLTGTANVLDTNGNNVSIAGVISGAGAITKRGAGILTVSGANNYTGATTITGGTLAIGASECLADTNSLILAGGTFGTQGYSETLGTLGLSASSSIDFGSGSSALSFSGLGTFDTTKTLSLLAWSSGADALFIGTSASLTTQQLAAIQFVNPTGYTGTFGATQLATGEIVALVPEPGLAMTLAIGSLALLARRKKR